MWRATVALGENCIKIIGDKPGSLGMFLEIQTDIGLKCHERASFMLKSIPYDPVFKNSGILILKNFPSNPFNAKEFPFDE